MADGDRFAVGSDRFAATLLLARAQEAESRLTAALARAERAEVECRALVERVRQAMELANYRWCEWGERATMVRDALNAAIAAPKENDHG